MALTEGVVDDFKKGKVARHHTVHPNLHHQRLQKGRDGVREVRKTLFEDLYCRMKVDLLSIIKCVCYFSFFLPTPYGISCLYP